MSAFSLHIQDASHAEHFDMVTSFVGEDISGSFGILPGHTRMMTSLAIGLSRFRTGGEDWQYVATSGALLYFKNNILTLSTRHFFIDTDYMRISSALETQLLEEESRLKLQKHSLRRMEEEVLKRLWELDRHIS
jgi:F-type H+-transporting ATPase subunit epsilon